MVSISEPEFSRICAGIEADRAIIIDHNPIGEPSEILLWMLLSCLISYLSLDDTSTPCFTGRPDADTYYKAILYILKERRTDDFDPEPYLRRFMANDN